MLTKKFIGGTLLLTLTILFILTTFQNVGGEYKKVEAAPMAPTMEEFFYVPTKMQPTSVVQKTIEIKDIDNKGELKEEEAQIQKEEVKAQKKKKEEKKEKKDNKEKTEKISNTLYWLAKITFAEAEGEDDKGQQLVAEVVLNRVNSKYFPDDVKSVIFQGNGEQFQPVKDGRINLEPDERAIENARKVLDGEVDLINDDILYFSATSLGNTKVGSVWWKGVVTVFVHGGHVFAKQLPIE